MKNLFRIFFITVLSFGKCYGDKQPTYVLQCRESGLFSIFMDVIHCLHAYEHKQIKGLVINFNEAGLYYDPLKGENWWTYYFEPIEVGDTSGPLKIIQYSSAIFTERTSYSDHLKVINKYVFLKSKLKEFIDAFAATHFKGYTIGVHYRGTDKKTENPRVSYSQMISVIQESVDSKKGKCTIFVATDEQQFLEQMLICFPGKVCYLDTKRSADTESPLHLDPMRDPYQCGESSIIDCVLLSKTNFLIRTESNLSECARYFNPRIKGYLVNPSVATFFAPGTSR